MSKIKIIFLFYKLMQYNNIYPVSYKFDFIIQLARNVTRL